MRSMVCGSTTPTATARARARIDAADVEAVFVRDQLRVVDAEERRVGVEDDAGGDDRAGQTAAADFVRAGDAPKTKIAEPALDRGHLSDARQLREEASRRASRSAVSSPFS